MGAGDPPVVPSQGLDEKAASLPGGAGDPPVVTSQDEVEGDTLMWTFYEKPTSSSRVLKATSAYTWRAKLVTLNMEVFRRLRNTSRQVTIMSRVWMLRKFVSKLRASGYSRATVAGIILSGSKFYYRKLRTELEGGPRVNARCDKMDVQRKRAKLGAAERWFRRRRGGEREIARKDMGWRKDTTEKEPRLDRGGCWTGPRVTSPRVAMDARNDPTLGAGPAQQDTKEKDKQIESTLMVPFTAGSALQKMIQREEDTYSKTVKANRVRVVERGGDMLSHLLCRNDPWAARRFCYDKSCVTCKSRLWLQEQTKAALKAKEKLPDELEKTTVSQCRREGINYTIQCLTCIPLGLKTLYRGEGARSARQRQGEHFRDLDSGTVASPLVIHALEEHGGQKPDMLAIVDKLEPSALYRAARESVKIAKLPEGPTNMNRCQEWGAPRVPVVSVMGGGDDPDLDGDREDGETGVRRRSAYAKPGANNPRLEWTAEMMLKVKEGSIKRVKLVSAWDKDKDNGNVDDILGQRNDHTQPATKRRRMDLGLDLDDGGNDIVVTASVDNVVDDPGSQSGPSHVSLSPNDADCAGSENDAIINIEDCSVVVVVAKDKVELGEEGAVVVPEDTTTREERGGDDAGPSTADDDEQGGGEDSQPKVPTEAGQQEDCTISHPKIDNKDKPVTPSPEDAMGLEARTLTRQPTFWHMCTDVRYREDKKTPRTGSLSSSKPLQPSLVPRSSRCAGVGPAKEGPRPGMRKPGTETRASLRGRMSSWLLQAQQPRTARPGSMGQPKMTDVAPTTTLTSRRGGSGEPQRKGGGDGREGGGDVEVEIERRRRSNTMESGGEKGGRQEPE